MKNLSDIVVLFVDDEADILSSLNRFLRKEPYQKLFAETTVKALELLECHDVAIVISDFNMPDMNGLELINMVKQRHPEIVPLIISGHESVGKIIESSHPRTIFRFITKPVEPITLRKVINDAIHFYRHEAGENRESLLTKTV
ncbi:MAG: response regulator [Pelodictyon phaeoclathratiforme]